MAWPARPAGRPEVASRVAVSAAGGSRLIRFSVIPSRELVINICTKINMSIEETTLFLRVPFLTSCYDQV